MVQLGEARYCSRVTAKGQITLPAEIRQVLGTEAKRYVEIEVGEESGEVIIKVRPRRCGKGFC